MDTPPEVELSISLDKLGFIIVKAREFDAKVEPAEARDEASNPTDDDEREVLEDSADDPTYQELVDALENLNEDELAEVVALSWLGRGEYDPSDWEEAVTDARDSRDERTVASLVGTPNLADEIEEGLAHLGLSIEDVEREHL
jgi:hypothetical protein